MQGNLEAIYDITILAYESIAVHLVNRGSQSNSNIRLGIATGIEPVGPLGGHCGYIAEGGFVATTFGSQFISRVHRQVLEVAVRAADNAGTAWGDTVRLIYCAPFRTKPIGATWIVIAGSRVWAHNFDEVA